MHSFFNLLPELLEEIRHAPDPSRLPVQVGEGAGFMYLRALVPGVDKENLELELRGQVLTISYNLPAQCGLYLRQARAAGAFRRSVDLCCPVRAEGIEASLENGVLTVTVPKKDPAGSCGTRRRIVCGGN